MSAFNKYFWQVYKNHYFDYHGRARRREYWLYNLFFYLIIFLTFLLAVPLSLKESSAQIVIFVALALFVLLSIPPSICLTIRRLHDTSQSGWLYLLSFIPYVGPLIIFVFMCIDSFPGENKYGPNPKEFPDLTAVFS